VSQQTSGPEASALAEYQRLLGLLDERRFDEAQVRARLLLESSEAGPLLRAKVHNLMCWTFIEGLKHATPEASLHGEEAVRLAAALGERSLQVQAMCNLASAYHQVGSYDLSRQTYQEIIAHLTREPSLVTCGLIIAYQGLAQLDLGLGRPHEALHYLDTARTYCRDEECRFLRADLDRRQALVLLELQRPEEAAETLAHIDDAVYSSGPRSLWWKTHLAFTRARVQLAQGHWGEARTLITNAMALARELGDMPVLAESTCLMALLEQAEGRKDALKRAKRALAYAIHTGRRDVVNDVRHRLRDLLSREL
jgi:tetratricopeptide (TPR) repeat protein